MNRLTTPYDSRTDADEIVSQVRLPGRRMIVTGGASGIGIETVRSLARTGAEVILAVRDTSAAKTVATEISSSTGNPSVGVAFLDLADQSSIRAFVRAWRGPLHVLVNNAGVMACPLARTAEGWELQFATNHLGHFALATGLYPALQRAGGFARVVSVSSSAHHRSGVIFEDIHYERRLYDPRLAYAQSKTANILFVVEAARRWAKDGILVNALMPGAIHTNLQRHLMPPKPNVPQSNTSTREAGFKTPQQGAATSVLLAVSPLIEGISGRYFDNCNEADPNVHSGRQGVSPHALDPTAAARLWEVSLELKATST